METIIAHTALVDPRAELDDDVRIGPFCVIGPHVKIGRGTRLENSVTLTVIRRLVVTIISSQDVSSGESRRISVIKVRQPKW